VSDESYETAAAISLNPEVSEQEAANQVLRDQLGEAQEGIRQAAVALFRIHPDDLHS